MQIRLIDWDGWEKTIRLEKSITRIGSSMDNDVVLQSNDIAPLQLQLMADLSEGNRCKLFNFAGTLRITRNQETNTVDAMSSYELSEGDTLHLGSFSIVIHLNTLAEGEKKSAHISAQLRISEGALTPDQPISGEIVLRNMGEDRGCQFRLYFEGLPDDCIFCEPLPHLRPGGEASAGFIIVHKGLYPEPGYHDLIFQLSAPADYFGEMIVFTPTIYVAAYYEDNLRLLDDSATARIRQNETERAKPKENEIAAQLPVVELKSIQNRTPVSTQAVLEEQTFHETLIEDQVTVIPIEQSTVEVLQPVGISEENGTDMRFQSTFDVDGDVADEKPILSDLAAQAETAPEISEKQDDQRPTETDTSFTTDVSTQGEPVLTNDLPIQAEIAKEPALITEDEAEPSVPLVERTSPQKVTQQAKVQVFGHATHSFFDDCDDQPDESEAKEISREIKVIRPSSAKNWDLD